jgi:hypothetical protein
VCILGFSGASKIKGSAEADPFVLFQKLLVPKGGLEVASGLPALRSTRAFLLTAILPNGLILAIRSAQKRRSRPIATIKK